MELTDSYLQAFFDLYIDKRKFRKFIKKLKEKVCCGKQFGGTYDNDWTCGDFLEGKKYICKHCHKLLKEINKEVGEALA